jgi:hypothetical protein
MVLNTTGMTSDSSALRSVFNDSLSISFF